MKTINMPNKKFWIVSIIYLILMISLFLQSCSDEQKVGPEIDYLNQVFSSTKPIQNIQYGSHPQYNQVEFIEAEGNLETNRPLILLSPGGAFQKYNQIESLRLMGRDLALRGYAVGIVKYTLKKGDVTLETYFKSIQDQKSSIRYFKREAANYRIDPDKIFIGGWSNGGSISYITAFYDDEDINNISQLVVREQIQSLLDKQGLEGDDNPGYSSDVKGALILNSTTLDEKIIQSNEAALMLIHHEKARFSDGTLTLGKFTHSGINNVGAQPVYEHARSIGFTEGNNLEYILMDVWDHTQANFEPNYTVLSSDNYDRIALFFHNNLN